jgi:hypothetical protein
MGEPRVAAGHGFTEVNAGRCGTLLRFVRTSLGGLRPRENRENVDARLLARGKRPDGRAPLVGCHAAVGSVSGSTCQTALQSRQRQIRTVFRKVDVTSVEPHIGHTLQVTAGMLHTAAKAQPPLARGFTRSVQAVRRVSCGATAHSVRHREQRYSVEPGHATTVPTALNLSLRVQNGHAGVKDALVLTCMACNERRIVPKPPRSGPVR